MTKKSGAVTNVRTKSRNHVLAAKSTIEQFRDASLTTTGGDVSDPVSEDGPLASTDALQEWTVALLGVEDADQAMRHDPRGMVPALMACDFWVLAVPEKGRPLPSYEVHGHPQEVVWRLRNFRTAKLPWRPIVGSRVGVQYVVDWCVLVHEKELAWLDTQENHSRGGDGTGPS